MQTTRLFSIALASLALVGAIGCGSSGGGTTTPADITYSQVDRLARPVVNEALASVANNRHDVNNRAIPNDDSLELANDIRGFAKNTAGRSDAVANVLVAVLVPDVLVADLSQTGEAAYLGNETGGATSGAGSTFGGRKLADDVVDISLGAVFGNTVSALGLAPNDGAAIPALTSDNVGAGAKRFTNTFPYLGAPR